MEKIQQVAIRGTPDLILCKGGMFLAVELKVNEEEPDELQKFKMEEIRKAGGIAIVARPANANIVYDFIKAL